MDKKQKFAKYQWIEADIARDTRDPRPESYKLFGNITPLQRIATGENWKARKGLVLNDVYTNLSQLINKARDTKTFTSLATFKPAKIIAFSMVKTKPATDVKKKLAILQGRLCEDKTKNLADIIPYKFYYTIIDDSGKRSRMQILDWEIYQLCRKLMRKYGEKKGLVYKHLKAKYFNEFVEKRDIHLFLGTSKYWHIRRSKNPFMIITLPFSFLYHFLS